MQAHYTHQTLNKSRFWRLKLSEPGLPEPGFLPPPKEALRGPRGGLRSPPLTPHSFATGLAGLVVAFALRTTQSLPNDTRGPLKTLIRWFGRSPTHLKQKDLKK